MNCIMMVARHLLSKLVAFFSLLLNCHSHCLPVAPPRHIQSVTIRLDGRSFRHMGCAHGCREGYRGPSAEFLRSQAQLLLTRLLKIDELNVSTAAISWICACSCAEFVGTMED